jgi:hypothetical protein
MARPSKPSYDHLQVARERRDLKPAPPKTGKRGRPASRATGTGPANRAERPPWGRRLLHRLA